MLALVIVETTLLLSVASLYIVHCPFNKVEESFNTQAIHDIINLFPYRTPDDDILKIDELNIKQREIAVRSELPWDHIQFPGVVPRTFLGALAVGIPLKFAKFLMLGSENSTESSPESEYTSEPDLTTQFVLQIGSRFALSSILILSLNKVLNAIHKKYGLPFRLCFLISTISQFHYMFYAGRFLPNTYAAILLNLVLAAWINRKYSVAVIYISICVVIFRFDTCLFFGWLLFDGAFLRKCVSIRRILKIGIPSGLVCLIISFLIDSHFWARPVIPELESLHFNVWLNKSHEWGTLPFFWYIYNCIPRILMAGVPFTFFADHKITRDYMIPTLTFILTYSFLPHKELRFILFITPYLNICVASGLLNVLYSIDQAINYLKSLIKRERPSIANQSKVSRMIFVPILIAMVAFNIFGCFIMSRVSSQNYPGGHAALSLGMTKELLDKAQGSLAKGIVGSAVHDPRSDVGVYVNNLAAQSGVSRFVQVDGVYYSKAPKLDTSAFGKPYDLLYLILEPKEVRSYLRRDCTNTELLKGGVEKWKSSNREMRCKLPNQPQMYCSILDTIHSFDSINIGGILRRLEEVVSLRSPVESLGDSKFIRSRIALYIIRCSTRSKFDPFS